MAEDRDPLDMVRQRLDTSEITATIQHFEQGTHTAADAAKAVGCEIAQIAKSIVFDTNTGPLIIVASGMNRVDKRVVGNALGLKLHSVGAGYLRDKLSLEPGGVSPLAADPRVPSILDRSLLRFDNIWLSAGTPSHLLNIGVVQLCELCRPQVMPIC